MHDPAQGAFYKPPLVRQACAELAEVLTTGSEPQGDIFHQLRLSFFQENTMTVKQNAKYDIIGIGSPLMDYMVDADDALLSKLGLSLGSMKLIDQNESMAIRSLVSSRITSHIPGGSASNTVAGAALLGSKTAFMGSIGSDDEGELYISQTERAGVTCLLKKHDALTGHAIAFITPGGERTFATHLGAAVNLVKEDVDVEAISQSRILHVEGYLLEPPTSREVAITAMEAAKKAKTLVSIDVADSGLVARMSDSLKSLLREYADILFMNDDEARAFSGFENEDAARAAQKYAGIAIVKIGAEGSIIATENETLRIKSYPVKLVNTNGAGDMYAAGFLHALAKGMTLDQAGRIGSYAASRVVGSVGARLDARPDVESIL
jgi:sugar/nucleoside kinase (ribokinase family)